MPEHDDPPDDLSVEAAGPSGLEDRLAAICSPTLTDLGFELVSVTVFGRDRPTVQIMADRADGSLIGVQDCEMISRSVGAIFDVEDVIKSAWHLEVSSAGIDRPLTRVKDWNRFSGHAARVEMLIPVEGRKRFTGLVLGADEIAGRLHLEDGVEVTLPLRDIRRAKLLLTDALIKATAPGAKPN